MEVEPPAGAPLVVARPVLGLQAVGRQQQERQRRVKGAKAAAVARQKRLWLLQRRAALRKLARPQPQQQQQHVPNPFMMPSTAAGQRRPQPFVQPRAFVPIGKPRVVAEAGLRKKRQELSHKARAHREAVFARIVAVSDGKDKRRQVKLFKVLSGSHHR